MQGAAPPGVPASVSSRSACRQAGPSRGASLTSGLSPTSAGTGPFFLGDGVPPVPTVFPCTHVCPCEQVSPSYRDPGPAGVTPFSSDVTPSAHGEDWPVETHPGTPGGPRPAVGAAASSHPERAGAPSCGSLARPGCVPVAVQAPLLCSDTAGLLEVTARPLGRGRDVTPTEAPAGLLVVPTLKSTGGTSPRAVQDRAQNGSPEEPEGARATASTPSARLGTAAVVTGQVSACRRTQGPGGQRGGATAHIVTKPH